jgi:hypothetical protein
MPGVTNTVLGDQVFIEGSLGIGGLGTQVVSGIRDKAGNPMRATELNGDTLVTIFLGEGFDYGDAPDPNYASRRDNNGPRHKVAEGFSFGSTNTADPDARVPDEDIDDGLVFQSIVSGFTGSFQFSVQGVTLARPAYVGAWIDFNGNGAFDSSEKINIPGRIVNGLNTAVVFGVPADAVTDRPVAARFRLSSDQAAIGSPLGEAIDGEVEDWMVTIGKNPYTNPNNKYDVTGDGFVSPIDVLQIVNYINAGFPSRPTLPPAAVPPYLDVNGDGFINALDVLAVIDFINSNINGGTGSGEGEGSSVGDSWISARSVPQSAPSATPSGNGSTNSSAGSSMHFDRPGVRIAVGSNSSTDRTFANMFGEDSELAFDVIDLTSDELGSDKQTDSSEASADRELVSILGEVLDDLL